MLFAYLFERRIYKPHVLLLIPGVHDPAEQHVVVEQFEVFIRWYRRYAFVAVLEYETVTLASKALLVHYYLFSVDLELLTLRSVQSVADLLEVAVYVMGEVLNER